MERSARFAAVLLLHHGGSVADEFSKNRDRLFAGAVEPISVAAAARSLRSLTAYGIEVFCWLRPWDAWNVYFGLV